MYKLKYKVLDILLVAIILISLSGIASAIDVTECGTLNTTDGIYNLIQNVSSLGTCFVIEAHNITIDGHGYTINYSQTVDIYGFGINNQGYDNITIINLSIEPYGESNTDGGIELYNSNDCIIQNVHVLMIEGIGIYLETTTNTSILNSTVYSKNSWGVGLYLSNDNIIENTTMQSDSDCGIGIYASNNNKILNSVGISDIGCGVDFAYSPVNNTFIGGSYSSSGYDYFLVTAGDTNYFRNTNFTAQRKIHFYDTTSWFNYNDEPNGNIWLKNNVSSAATINRTLLNWSQLKMKWIDSGVAVTSYYILTGIYPNTVYNVYINSIDSYELTTDNDGELPMFSVEFNSDMEIEVFTSSPPTPTVTASTVGSIAQQNIAYKTYQGLSIASILGFILIAMMIVSILIGAMSGVINGKVAIFSIITVVVFGILIVIFIIINDAIVNI